MIIKVKIAAAGQRSYTRIPRPAYTMEECLDPKTGKFDGWRAALAFADNPECFTASSSDNDRVYWASMTLLKNIQRAYDTVIESADIDATADAVSRADEIVARRMERGKFVYCRINIAATAAGANASVRIDNPHGVVGGAEAEATHFAVVCVQVLRRMAAHARWLAIKSVDTAIAERADELAQRADDRAAYADCDRRTTGGFCSPCDFQCKFFRAGRCGYDA